MEQRTRQLKRMHNVSNLVRSVLRTTEICTTLRAAKLLDEAEEVSARELVKLSALVQV